jgi:hypothetical protein
MVSEKAIVHFESSSLFANPYIYSTANELNPMQGIIEEAVKLSRPERNLYVQEAYYNRLEEY